MDSPPDPPVRLSREQLTAWRNFLRVHAVVNKALELDLNRERDLPLTWYDVMVQLVEAPQRRLRMTDLAERVLLSRSGLTRLVDRMANAGLVRREPCEDDARGSYAVLTQVGFERIKGASALHLQGVNRYMMRHIEGDDLDILDKVLRRVLEAHGMAPDVYPE